MSKKILIPTLLISFFLVPQVSAQTNSASRSARPQIINDRLMEKEEERQELKALIEERREIKKTEIQTKREEFDLKLQQVTDERKQAIIEKTDERLILINQKAVSRLTSGIEKLEELLDKFSQRVEEAKSEGKDTTNAEIAITEAESAIEEAKIAIAEQAANEYVAEIESEETLGNAVGQAVSSLRQDIKSTFEYVRLAKQKVMNVARAVARLRSQEKVASPSADIEEDSSATGSSEL